MLERIKNNKLTFTLAGLVLVASAAGGMVAAAHADTSTTQSSSSTSSGWSGNRTPPTAVGKVTAVDGTTITMTNQKDNTTYTVDASGATITKVTKPTAQGQKPTSATITASQVAVGDMIVVDGTKNGTDIAATKITDGMMFGFGGPRGMMPGVMGTVSAIDGSTITVTGKDGTTYTVSAGNASVSKNETISVSDIQVGDSVGIQGTVSGTNVTATHIMDGMPKPASTQTSSQ